jgi:hypothetical protein
MIQLDFSIDPELAFAYYIPVRITSIINMLSSPRVVFIFSDLLIKNYLLCLSLFFNTLWNPLASGYLPMKYFFPSKYPSLVWHIVTKMFSKNALCYIWYNLSFISSRVCLKSSISNYISSCSVNL